MIYSPFLYKIYFLKPAETPCESEELLAAMNTQKTDNYNNREFDSC